MLTRILHKIVAHPRIYDWVQMLAGAELLRRRLAVIVVQRCHSSPGIVLDLGGGTGLYRGLWPSAGHYVCLDLDMAKLRGFREKRSGDPALCADATRVPFNTGSVDVVVCTSLSHHLSDEHLEQMVSESARILRAGGTFVFIDPVWAPSRPIGRLIWKYDRGSHPRRPGHLHAVISNHLRVVHEERYAIYHEYLLCVGTKPQDLI